MSDESVEALPIRAYYEVVLYPLDTVYACPVCRALINDTVWDLRKHKEWHEKLGDWES